MIQIEKRISPEEVLKRIPQELIFSKYLSNFVVGKSFNAPWRKDEYPSISTYYNDKGFLVWVDKARREYGNCFNLVSKIFSISYFEAVKKVDEDFKNQKFENIPIKRQREKKVFRFEFDNFNQNDLNYWMKFGITEDILKFFDVKVAKKVFVNDNLRWIYTNYNPIYVYQEKDYYQVYRPLEKKGFKWLSNSSTVLQGITKLPEKVDFLIITKSRKDLMCLKGMGLYGVAPRSESVLITDEEVKLLKSKANKIISIFDFDYCGITQAQYLKKKHQIPYLFMSTNRKERRLDISDHYTLYGRDLTLKKIQEKQ